MTHVLKTHFPDRFRRACWATYIRCHDDIGWAISEEDTEAVPPLTGPGHRAFLADFYNGTFPGSFARGSDFQTNEETGDRRTCGSFASLAGLESALLSEDRAEIDAAVNRILLGHALIASFGGIPLIYMGDELGLTNDTTYLDDPDLRPDSRWAHRPRIDWTLARSAHQEESPHAWIWRGTRHLLWVRKGTPQLASDVPTVVLRHENPHLFAFARLADDCTLICVFNFTGSYQSVPATALGIDPDIHHHELVSCAPMAFPEGQVVLPPYGRAWIRPESEA